MVLDDRNTPEYIKFINNVFIKDDYKCIICGSPRFITVHHLDGYSWCVEGRTKISNGVTLCNSCHEKFHDEFGYGDNTADQFHIFYKREHDKLIYKILKNKKY